ncbi:MAG: bifunctional riboflavin kinase/FAD synthetase [Gammaproteobacteria bacterium]
MTTRLIRFPSLASIGLQGGVITIGNFDGVHCGHQALIAHVLQRAHELNLPTTVITFEPHPLEFFNKTHLTVPRITRLREKFKALAATGADNVVIIPFNQQLADMSASEFVQQILVKGLNAKHIVIGDDFRFGHKRLGDFSLLTNLGRESGFTVEAMPTLLLDHERVSSTRVRAALTSGQLDLAATLLGHSYTMQGRIRHGDKLGRELGFPTANIYLHRRLTPLHGIYTVYMHGLGALPVAGVANIGTRPTVNGTTTLLEVHLLDFSEDIYGRYVEVEFCQKVRDEERLPSLEILKEYIASDVAIAKAYFAGRED